MTDINTMKNWLVWTLSAYERAILLGAKDEGMPQQLKDWWEEYKDGVYAAAPPTDKVANMTFEQFCYWMRGFFDMPEYKDLDDEQLRDLRKVYRKCFKDLPVFEEVGPIRIKEKV
jgi:hypothetical protein